MTLSRGDRVIKLNPTTGAPLTTETESYIEYEVHDLGQHLSLIRPTTNPEAPDNRGPETFMVVLLRKLR